MKDRSILAALSGIILDSYNNTLFGFFAASLSSLFFPPGLFVSPMVASFATFAAGFALRPIGGILFGYIGDRFGRRLSLQLTILVTAIPTFIIGILPSYETLGMLAPVILLICRLLQGISIASDYTGVIIYVAEQRGIRNHTFVMCFLVACGFLGALLGISVSFLLTYGMSPSWGWRLSFIIGGVVSLIVYFLRLRMKESPLFEESEREKPSKINPFVAVLKEDKVKLLACSIFGGANLVPIYLATVYLNAEFKERLGFTTHEILLNNFWILLFGTLLVLMSTKLITRFGEAAVMKGCLCYYILFSIPVYLWAINISSEFSLVMLQLFMMLGDAPQIAALVIYLPKLFLPSRRYSGIGFSYALGQALLGGTTPILATFLITSTGHAWAPSYLLSLVSFFYLMAILKTEKRLVTNFTTRHFTEPTRNYLK
jgi:MHS family proline/betaine transporter-like MFS transporter